METNTQRTMQNESKKINLKSYFSAFLPNPESRIPEFANSESADLTPWAQTLGRSSIRRGFTLIETLVAIAVLLVAVVGPISLIGDAVHKLYYAKDEMIAINLAQEGIESVRQMRDSNMLAGAAWNFSLDVNDYIVDVGRVKTVGQVPLVVYSAAGVGLPQPVYLNAGLYRQGTIATPTQFKRILTITTVAGNINERKVSVLVTWQTGGQVGSIVVSENIFKWLP